MTAVHAQLTEHGGALDGHAGNAQRTWHERSGLLLTLRDADGHTGLGEASPLPGYSAETLDACRRGLQQVPWTLALERLRAQPDISGFAALDAFIAPHLAAARFAAETALADLMAQSSGLPLWAWLSGRSSAPDIELCHLADVGPSADVFGHVERLYGAGIRCFKLKIGRDWRAELRVLERLRAHFGDGIVLRCDANQNFTLDTARQFFDAAGPLALEFVEEPLPLHELTSLDTRATPLALDESLRGERGRAALQSSRDVHALVLKPMALGGFSACAAIAEAARPEQQLIFSHLFDGPVAWAATANAALAWGSRRTAAGLAPHSGLSAWPRADVASCTLVRRDNSFHALTPGPAWQLSAKKGLGLGLSWSPT